LRGLVVTTSSYDAVGNLTRQVDRRGKVIDFGYDGPDRRVTETWRDTIGGAAVKTLGFSYNSIDQLLTASDGGVNKLVRTYDKLARLKTDEQTDAKGLLTYSYDAASKKTLTALAINGTSDLSNAYSFDKLGRMTAIQQSGGGSRQKRAEFAYDKLDRQTGITRKEFNGSSLVTVSTSAQVFDFAGRLTSLQHYGINTGVVLAGYSLNWDAGDRIESITSVADGLVTFSYDATDQRNRTPPPSVGRGLTTGRVIGGGRGERACDRLPGVVRPGDRRGSPGDDRASRHAEASRSSSYPRPTLAGAHPRDRRGHRGHCEPRWQ
jgi:YD repeat-containing protein